MARTATVTRNTRETQITLTIDLDGTGRADLHTGIGFFDHMLDGFARHGLFDVSVTCRGDLHCAGHGHKRSAGRQGRAGAVRQLHAADG